MHIINMDQLQRLTLPDKKVISIDTFAYKFIFYVKETSKSKFPQSLS